MIDKHSDDSRQKPSAGTANSEHTHTFFIGLVAACKDLHMYAITGLKEPLPLAYDCCIVSE